jgi:hypothetical protein
VALELAEAWARLQRSPAFWDVDTAQLNPDRHADWIIARVFQFGHWEDWLAVFATYPPAVIRAALGHRRVPEHIRQFWEAYWEEDSAMHPETLHPATHALWQRLGPALCPSGYLLAGGTALALYLGHRQSEDLDFMTMTPGDPGVIAAALQAREPSTMVRDRSAHRLHLQIRGVKVSYLWQPGVRLDAGAVVDGIPLASPSTLAALTCHAVAHRGARKDFIDVVALLEAGWSLPQLLDAAQDHAPALDRGHLLRRLTDFADAEQEPDPVLFRPLPWETVRYTLERHVRAYLRQQLPPPGPRL